MPQRKNDVHTWCISIYHVVGLKQTRGHQKCYSEGGNKNYLWVSQSTAGFVRVLENPESPGILLWHFQDWKVLEKGHGSWKVLVVC